MKDQDKIFDDPNKVVFYFEKVKLNEALIINFRYDKLNNLITLVTDLPWNSKGYLEKTDNSSIFHKAIFYGVEELVTNLSFANGIKFNYSLKENAPPLLLQVLEIYTLETGKIFCNIYIDSQIGECSFSFEKLSINRRKGRVSTLNDKFIYTDYSSNELMDFYNPFNLIDFETGRKA